MEIGIAIRSMGPQSNRELLLACVEAAERAGLADVWVQDHLAIPPDDAEGSGGRYLDPLTTLAWLAGATERIGLGTGVLNIPYRAPLPTAKAIATVQELSAGRMKFGVGVGWMQPEFVALGVDRSQRGRMTDEGLAFIRRCFDADAMEANGQPFLFLPRPARPPIYIGGAAPHALKRAVEYGDGWFPMGGDPKKLAPAIHELRARAAEAGRPEPEVKLLTALPLESQEAARDAIASLRASGVTSLVHALRYDTLDEFQRVVDRLEPLVA